MCQTKENQIQITEDMQSLIRRKTETETITSYSIPIRMAKQKMPRAD